MAGFKQLLVALMGAAFVSASNSTNSTNATGGNATTTTTAAVPGNVTTTTTAAVPGNATTTTTVAGTTTTPKTATKEKAAEGAPTYNKDTEGQAFGSVSATFESKTPISKESLENSTFVQDTKTAIVDAINEEIAKASTTTAAATGATTTPAATNSTRQLAETKITAAMVTIYNLQVTKVGADYSVTFEYAITMPKAALQAVKDAQTAAGASGGSFSKKFTEAVKSSVPSATVKKFEGKKKEPAADPSSAFRLTCVSALVVAMSTLM